MSNLLQGISIKRKLAVITLLLISLFIMGLAAIHSYLSLDILYSGSYQIWQVILINIQIIVEFIVFLQSGLILFSVAEILNPKTYDLKSKEIEDYPELDVFIPIREVNVDTLEKTLQGFKEDPYPDNKLHLYIADDTPDTNLSDSYRALANKYEAKYIYDPTNNLYKSGMLNIALPEGKSDFVCFFDYDQIPINGILKHFVEVLYGNPDAAFVQAKKRFRDLYNLSRVWSALLYVQFFEVFEKIKMKNETVLFAGSTACFRRDILDEIGGIPEDTFTEDNELSAVLLINGYHGVFTDIDGSVGTVPYGFRAQISQLWRWSHGGAHVVKKYYKEILKSSHLNISQKLDVLSVNIITPILLGVYVYAFSFIPLILSGVDSPRPIIFGTTSLTWVVIMPALTYLILVFISVWYVKQNDYSEFSYIGALPFMIIGFASNILILRSGLTGILGIWGPKSKRGRWTRDIKILRNSIIAFILGLVIMYFSIQWILAGFSSAIVLILISSTLIITLPVVLYYDRDVKN